MGKMCLPSSAIHSGLYADLAFPWGDLQSKNIGVKRLVPFYDLRRSAYAVHRIGYVDGCVQHEA
jgi:hypothetical protein